MALLREPPTESSCVASLPQFLSALPSSLQLKVELLLLLELLSWGWWSLGGSSCLLSSRCVLPLLLSLVPPLLLHL